MGSGVVGVGKVGLLAFCWSCGPDSYSQGGAVESLGPGTLLQGCGHLFVWSGAVGVGNVGLLVFCWGCGPDLCSQDGAVESLGSGPLLQSCKQRSLAIQIQGAHFVGLCWLVVYFPFPNDLMGRWRLGQLME